MLYEVECQCAGGALNPGQIGCMPQVRRDKFPIFMHYKNSTGVLNSVPAGTVMNKTWLESKFNHVDPTMRWIMFPQFENLAGGEVTPETEDIGGKPIPTGETVKAPFTWEHFGAEANPALVACYDSIKCEDLGVMYVTFSGQLNAMNDGNGNLVPIHVQKGSLTAVYAPPKKQVVQKVMCSMIIDELENDANRDYIDSGSIAYPAKDWFALQPFEVIPYDVSNSGQDTIVIKLHSLYGGVGFKKPVKGIVSADFSNDGGVTDAKVYNETDNASITVVSVEIEPGVYKLTLATPQTAADVILIELFKTQHNMRPHRVTLS